MSKITEAFSSRFKKDPVPEQKPTILTPHEEALKNFMDRGVLDAIDQAIEKIRLQHGEESVAYPHLELDLGGEYSDQLATLWIRLNPKATRFRSSSHLIERWESKSTQVVLYPRSISICTPMANKDNDGPSLWNGKGFPDANLRKDSLVEGLYSAFREGVFLLDNRLGEDPSRLSGSSEGRPTAQKIVLVDSSGGKIPRLQQQLSLV